MIRRRSALVALGLVAAPAFAQSASAPNYVPVSRTLATSGQPTERALRAFGRQGFEAVVSLVPNDVSGVVRAEPAILAAQGIEFVHVPIPFDAPDESHLRALTATLDRLSGRKVLVHCEVNMRASTLVFLYRVLTLHEAPGEAYEAVAIVWSPRGPWRGLIVEQLAKHGIAFEPY